MHYTDLHEDTQQDEDFYTNLEHAIPIFQKPFEDRTHKENKLVIHILNQVPYFNKYCYLYNHYAEEDKYLSQALKESKKKEALKNLSKFFKYENYPAGTAINHLGDPTSKFYLVLKGEVRRYVARSFNDVQKEIKIQANGGSKGTSEKKKLYKAELEPERLSIESKTTICPNSLDSLTTTPDIRKTESTRPSIDTIGEDQEKTRENQAAGGNIQQRATAEEIRMFKRFRLDKKYFLSNVLAVKHSKSFLGGDYIGEMSLGFNVDSSETLIAWTNTQLVTIAKEDFAQIFDTVISQNREKLDLVAELLPELPTNEITTFAYGFEQIHYRAPTTIFQSGAAIDGLYIVKEGQVEILTTTGSESSGNSLLSLLKTNTKSQKTSILIVSRGQFFGEEALLSREKREFTAVTRTYNTVVYFIPHKHLAKMAFYNLSIMGYMTSLAETLYTAKIKLLESMTKQPTKSPKKEFMNHISERYNDEEKEYLAGALAELERKDREYQANIVKNGFVRVVKTKNPVHLDEEHNEPEIIVEPKKELALPEGRLGPIILKHERYRDKALIQSSQREKSMLKFLQKIPDELSEKRKLPTPLSIWDYERKNYVPKKYLDIDDHSIPGHNSTHVLPAVRPKHMQAFIGVKKVSKLDHNIDELLNKKENHTSVQEDHVLFDIFKNESRLTPRQTPTGHNLPRKKVVKFSKQIVKKQQIESVSPILIQGLVTTKKNANIPCEMNLKEDFGTKRIDTASLLNKKVGKIIVGEGLLKSKYVCSNLENTSFGENNIALPALRPQKILVSAISRQELEKFNCKRVSGLFRRKSIKKF